MRFLLFYSPKPRSQVRILIYLKWPITHEQNMICSKTHLHGTTHEQAIICRRLIAGHLMGSRQVKGKEKNASNDNMFVKT